MTSFKIAVILPSRGLMFSQTAEELLEALRGVPHTIFFSHGQPIPDCFEKPLEQALHGSYSHVWFVEDDMILPPNILTTMVRLNKDVVVADYPVSKKGQGAILKNDEGRVLFSGTGCLLVKTEVFKKLRKPYFRTDIKWIAQNHGKFVRLTAWPIKQRGYGLHDVNFGMKLWDAGIEMTDCGVTLGQRKLIKLGEAGTNDGAHQIEEWTKVKPDYLMEQYKKYPVIPLGNLESVIANDGTEITTNKTTAKKMVAEGRATPQKKNNISIDFNGVEL